jgi:hypothetical protein
MEVLGGALGVIRLNLVLSNIKMVDQSSLRTTRHLEEALSPMNENILSCKPREVKQSRNGTGQFQ